MNGFNNWDDKRDCIGARSERRNESAEILKTRVPKYHFNKKIKKHPLNSSGRVPHIEAKPKLLCNEYLSIKTFSKSFLKNVWTAFDSNELTVFG